MQLARPETTGQRIAGIIAAAEPEIDQRLAFHPMTDLGNADRNTPRIEGDVDLYRELSGACTRPNIACEGIGTARATPSLSDGPSIDPPRTGNDSVCRSPPSERFARVIVPPSRSTISLAM